MGIVESLFQGNRFRKRRLSACTAQAACAGRRSRPCRGAVIAIQTLGDFLGFNPHLHVLCSDGCFYGEDGRFGTFKGRWPGALPAQSERPSLDAGSFVEWICVFDLKKVPPD